jgi:signal transduction histidine kinase
MPSRKSAKLAFATALVLLLLCGVAALIAISRYSNSAQWVVHTYEVQVATGAVESTLSDAARDRWIYINLGDKSFLQQYELSKKEVSENLWRVRDLTLDNPNQRGLLSRLDGLVNQRISLLQTSVDARATHQADGTLQDTITLENTKLAGDIAGVINEMQNQENAVLQARKKAASRLFYVMLSILAAMLASALVLFWVHYRLLNDELGKREEAESGARRLSAHVLQLQDEERRKFSRELHDSLGQNLAAAKMIAFALLERHANEESVPGLLEILERSIQETRTISHLLHPPLLDELGIASAVSWYVDGFAQRSGLKISLKISDRIGRLSRPVELVLFRVLQESLTNVHRHAKSQRADVSLGVTDGCAVLQVRDYGIGMPLEVLHHFRSNGTQVGVGLTGMRERVREQGGQFEIYSDKTGTEVLVTIPLDAAQNWSEEIAAARDAD